MTMGLIHLYTGEGKGKTTAALGLTLRACGAGCKVVILQFMKGRETSEVASLALLPTVTVLRNAGAMGFWTYMDDEKKAARRAEHNENLRQALWLVDEDQCDLLVLDEVVSAYNCGALDCALIDDLIKNKPPQLELVLTGRSPAAVFTENADYITEMKKVRHPFDRGIEARRGIEK